MFLERYTHEYLYPAYEAGLKYFDNSDTKGLHLNFSGFNEKLEVLIDSVTKLMANFSTSMEEEFFLDIKKSFKTKCYGHIIDTKIMTL